MSPRAASAASILLALAALALGAFPARSDAPAGKRYVCPPCGQPCDDQVYEKPGTCPKCGMTLVDRDAAAAEAASRKKVGILIFDGVQIIDYTGPYEIFQAAGFDVYTVAATKEPITTVAGMRVVPRYAFDDAPPPDVLVVPGGGIAGALASAPTLKWVREVAAKATHTMSVCNGAFILAKTGLLDGLTATTTNGNVASLRAEYPKITVVDDRRFVDNGRIVTAGGLTAGIDGALHVVSVTLGPGVAQEVALGEEYDWRPDGGFVRGVLADTNVRPWIDGSLDGAGRFRLLKTEGGTDRWEIVARGTSELSAGALTERFAKACESKGGWSRVKDPGAGSPPSVTSRWTFTGRDGKPWGGTLTVQPSAGAAGEYTLTLSIARSGAATAG